MTGRRPRDIHRFSPAPPGLFPEPPAKLANAPPPLFFARRGVRLRFLPPRNEPEGMERREAQPSADALDKPARPCANLPGGAAPGLPGARLAALHRGDLGLRDRVFRDSDGRLSTGPIAELSPRSSCPVQPIEGRPLIVGADGDPRPPGSGVTSPARRRRTPLRRPSVPRRRPRRARRH
jgi:hypothetical protein